MTQTRTAQTEYVGQDPGAAPGGNGAAPSGLSSMANMDLRRVTFGADTFSNPFFWIFVGVAGTIAVQWLFKRYGK